MMRAPWATHFGFTKLPFSKNVSAKDLLDRASHQEAVARIRFCIGGNGNTSTGAGGYQSKGNPGHAPNPFRLEERATSECGRRSGARSTAALAARLYSRQFLQRARW